jgi:hypothetical protein
VERTQLQQPKAQQVLLRLAQARQKPEPADQPQRQRVLVAQPQLEMRFAALWQRLAALPHELARRGLA